MYISWVKGECRGKFWDVQLPSTTHVILCAVSVLCLSSNCLYWFHLAFFGGRVYCFYHKFSCITLPTRLGVILLRFNKRYCCRFVAIKFFQTAMIVILLTCIHCYIKKKFMCILSPYVDELWSGTVDSSTNFGYGGNWSNGSCMRAHVHSCSLTHFLGYSTRTFSFFIYINDLYLHIFQLCERFADDITIGKSQTEWASCITTKAQTKLILVLNWSKSCGGKNESC